MTYAPTSVSLFSSGGIGDLAVHAAGYQVLVANELEPARAALLKRNFADCEVLVGDIWQLSEKFISTTKAALGGRPLDLLFATPPCQGMSKNGRGKLLQGIRAGLKPELDARNQLIIPTIDIVISLLPETLVIENVPEMEQTIIEHPNGGYIGLLEYIESTLSPVGYLGRQAVIEFADYGVPQRRQRLISVFTRSPSLARAMDAGAWLPPPSHGQQSSLLVRPWVTVDQAIGHLPPLDAKSKSTARGQLPLHYVPLLDEEKYFWVANTPPGGGAFDNQCVNQSCKFDGNPVHGNTSATGINQARRDTPIRCAKCNELLPRPWVRKNGQYRLMSGFTSAYRRMRGDQPASALTRNLSYACSDKKIHPTQNRVLSLLEATIIHTIDQYDYHWIRSDGAKTNDALIREVIGESIPPAGLQTLFSHWRKVIQLDQAEAA